MKSKFLKPFNFYQFNLINTILMSKLHLHYKNLRLFCLVALLIFDIFVAWQFYFTPKFELEITTDSISKGHGFSYRIQNLPPLPKTQYPFNKLSFDDHINSYRSTLQLYEDGKPLAPAHNIHTHISGKGKGGYSFWGGYPLFSTSDNTDPRTNGRTYTITSPHLFHHSVLILNTLGLLILFGLRGLRKLSWLIILTAIVYINHKVLTYTFGNPCLSTDSSHYLDFDIIRTPGYPIFIKLIMNTFGDLGGMITFQLNLLLGSFVALGYAVGRFTNSRVLALIFTLLLFSLLPLLQRSHMILTEVTFTAMLCFHFAAVALYFKKHSAKYAILSGLTLVIAILIRPAGYPLVGGILLLLLLLPEHRKLTILAVAGPFILGTLAASTLSLYKFGVFANQSFGGIALLGQVAYVLEGDDGKGTQYEKLISDIVEKNKSRMDTFTGLSYPDEYWKHTLHSYNHIAWMNNVPLIDEYIKKEYSGLTPYEQKHRHNTISMDISLIGIKSHPLSYARHVSAHYFGTWQGFLSNYGTLANHAFKCRERSKEQVNIAPHFYEKFLDPSDFTDAGMEKYAEQDLQATLLYRIWEMQFDEENWLRYLFFICSILALVFVFFKRTDPANGFVFYTAILLHAYLGFVASVQATLERYSLPFTPILYALSFMVIFLLWRCARSKISKLMAQAT